MQRLEHKFQAAVRRAFRGAALLRARPKCLLVKAQGDFFKKPSWQGVGAGPPQEGARFLWIRG